jgi:anti-anti-sigma factor
MFRQHVVRSREGDLLCASEQLIVRSERDGHAHVVELIGELDMHTAAVFEDELKRVEGTDAQKIIVDLRGLKWIGSDGLKTFIHANARSRRDGNRLVLVRGADHVQKIFETTGLLSRLPFAGHGDVSSLVRGDRSMGAHIVVSTPVHEWPGSVA